MVNPKINVSRKKKEFEDPSSCPPLNPVGRAPPIQPADTNLWDSQLAFEINLWQNTGMKGMLGGVT